MAANQGTHVIAMIVTPDSEDTFPTHNANDGKGGLQIRETFAELDAIPVERRSAKMWGNVWGDTEEVNGDYRLSQDLLVWEGPIEKCTGTIGDPPDAGWGRGESTTHLLTGLATGQTLEEGIDKILSYIDDTAQPPPPLVSALQFIIANLYSANRQGEAAHTQDDNIQVDTQPTGTLNGHFGNSNSGIAVAYIDLAETGSLPLTDSLEDNGTDGSLTLFNEEVFNDVYQQIQASVQSQVPLALNNTQHTYRLEHNGEGTEILFYVDDPAQPGITAASMAGVHQATPLLVSGVPSLAVGDGLQTSFTVTNAVSWYYNLGAVADVDSPFTSRTEPPTPTGLLRGDNIPFANIAVVVENGRYTENAFVEITGHNSRSKTGAAVGIDSTTIQQTGSTGPVRIDTVSNEGLTVGSGSGQYPNPGGNPGECGAAFDSTANLNGTEELQMVNGVIRWPETDYSTNQPTPGPDYSAAPGGSYNGYRWRTFDLGNITAQTSVTFSINGAQGFTGNPVESSTAMYVQVVGETGWVDANAPYPGAGNPATNGAAALDVGSSTATSKRVTFGAQPRTGRVLVRIGWPNSEPKQITLIQ